MSAVFYVLFLVKVFNLIRRVALKKYLNSNKTKKNEETVRVVTILTLLMAKAFFKFGQKLKNPLIT